MCVLMIASKAISRSVAVLVLAFSTVPTLLFAQATVGTGSIVGLITDPSGAVINGRECNDHQSCD